MVGADSPDLTLVLDLPIEAGLARAQRRGDAEQRFERKEAGFHRRLREGYLAIVQAEPERCRLIDAGGDPDQVAAAVWSAVRRRFAAEIGA